MKKNPVKEMFNKIYTKVLMPSAFLYTVISFIMMSVSELDAIRLSKAWLILLFSVAITLSNNIFGYKQMQLILRATLHFICYVASFAVIMLLGSGTFKNNSSGSLLLLIVFIVVYLLIIPIPVYLIYKKEKTSVQPTEYQSIYTRKQ